MGAPSVLLAAPEDIDAARRLRDAVNAFVEISRITRDQRDKPPFIGISLATGGCVDNVLYDAREDCARHLCAKDPYVFPVRIGADSMTFREAWCLLWHGRTAKARGAAFHEQDPVMAQRRELLRHIPSLPVPISFFRGLK